MGKRVCYVTLVFWGWGKQQFNLLYFLSVFLVAYKYATESKYISVKQKSLPLIVIFLCILTTRGTDQVSQPFTIHERSMAERAKIAKLHLTSIRLITKTLRNNKW